MTRTTSVTATSNRNRRKKAQQQAQQQQLLLAVIALGVLVVVVLVALLTQNTGTQVASSSYANLAQRTTSDGAPVLGNPDARVIFREFTNFACSACQQYQSTQHQIVEKYVATGQAQLEVRVLVWDRSGPNSMNAGFASMCAAQQGRFWEMHDALFSALGTFGATAYDISRIHQLANSIGADGEQVVDCILNRKTQTEIASNMQLAEQVGMTGTPALMYSLDGGATFHWFTMAGSDGQPVEYRGGGPTLDAFEQVIAAANAQ